MWSTFQNLQGADKQKDANLYHTILKDRNSANGWQ